MAYLVAKSACVCSLVLIAALSFAGQKEVPDDSASRFYKDSDKPGWHWYKDPPESEEVKPEPKRKPPSEQPKQEAPKEMEKAERRMPIMADYTKQQLWDLHPDDFKALLDDFHKKAVMTLSEKDIGEYLEMQDLARRKSLAYTNVATLVNQKRSDLSLEKDYTTSAPGRLAMAGVQNTERDKRIAASKENFALVYFYKNDCPYCTTQSEVMRSFSHYHGWTVQPVNIAQAPQLATKYNITTVPSLILVKKGLDDFLPIATGMVTLNHIDERVFSGIRLLNGEIRPEQFYMGDFEKGGGFDPLAPLQK